MKLRNLLFAVTALTGGVIVTPAYAIPTVFTDGAAFAAANPGLKTYGFPASGGLLKKAPLTYTLNGVSFVNGGAYVGNDSGYNGTPYFDDGGPLEIITANNVLGLYFGAFSGTQTIGYSVGGQTGTLVLGANQALSFLGFNSNGGPLDIQISGEFEHDVVAFFTKTNIDAGVPEPATWAMLIVGFGVVGIAARRRSRYTVTG